MVAKSSPEYWRDRMLDVMQRAEKKEDEVLKELYKIYDRSARELERVINDFYQQYATENGLTLAQARRKISRTSAKTLVTRIDSLLKKDNLTLQEEEQLSLLRAKFTTTRLQLLVNEMDLVLIEGYGQQQITMDQYLKRVAFETQQELAGDIQVFTRLAAEEIDYLIRIPWSGAEFSDRLWRNKEKLVFELQNIVTTGLIRGESTQSMARKLKRSVGNGKYETERLIRTETAHVLGQTSANFWEANGAKKYKFYALLDNRTSPQCRDRDGKIYNLKDRQVGTNYPPLHPFCRSFAAAYIEDDE